MLYKWLSLPKAWASLVLIGCSRQPKLQTEPHSTSAFRLVVGNLVVSEG
jgi:hypothetical protein